MRLSSLEDTISPDNQLRFIDAFVEYVDLSKLNFAVKTLKTEGRPSFNRKVFLKIYLYGYLNGVRSGRGLEKECLRNMEMQWLLEVIRPNYHSISDFRKDNPIAIIDVRFATYMQVYETPILTKYLSEVIKQGIIIRKKEDLQEAYICIPTIATVIWFSIFANSAFDIISTGDKTQFNNVFSSLFIFLEHFPFHFVTFFIAGLLVLISIINSVDSAIFVLGMFSDNGNENPSKRHKLGWGFIITATALGLTAIGTSELLNGISNLLVIMALPFSFLSGSIIFLFFKNIIINKEASDPISQS